MKDAVEISQGNKPLMRKAYVSRRQQRDVPQRHIWDYWFCDLAEGAMHWDTQESAQHACDIFECGQIGIPLAGGGVHVCQEFKVEELPNGNFVICCEAPFSTLNRPVN